jgi:hypothetical protein
MVKGTLTLTVYGDDKAARRVSSRKEIDDCIEVWKHIYGLTPKGANVPWIVTLTVSSKMREMKFKDDNN